MTASSKTTFKALKQLYREMSRRRKFQLMLVMALMLLGALAEIATLGAVLPFLALIANPAKATSFPALQLIFVQLGWQDPDRILLPATLLFVLIALAAAAIRVILTWASNEFVFMVGHDLGVEAYRRTLYQPYSYHLSHNSSEVVAVSSKVQIVTGGVLMPLMQAVIAATISIFILAALITIDPLAAFGAAGGFGLIYLLVTKITRRRLQSNSHTIARAHSQLVKTVQEGLGGIRDVLIDNAQPVYLEKFRSVNAPLRDAEATNAFINTAPRFVVEAAGMVLIACLALTLSMQGSGLAVALPVLGALALGAQRLLPLVQQSYFAAVMLRAHRDVLLDVTELVSLPIPAEHLAGKREKPLPFERDIVMEKVAFRYASDLPCVVSEIDLLIPKGTRLGIVGRTGSGKSTLVDLIMGLVEPTTGTIRVDDKPLKDRNRLAWQARIAHVPQAIFLSDTTIAENIAFSVPAAAIDLERVREAARMAMIADFIESLPDRYDAKVGERGVQLSGGQRQRIGIARALYRRADVLVFDEATSALDGKTEADVMRAIGALGRDLTVVVIAHRVSTVGFCDRVVRMEMGRIVESGTYEHVVREPKGERFTIGSEVPEDAS